MKQSRHYRKLKSSTKNFWPPNRFESKLSNIALPLNSCTFGRISQKWCCYFPLHCVCGIGLWLVQLQVMFTLIIRLKWYLPGFFTVNLVFFHLWIMTVFWWGTLNQHQHLSHLQIFKLFLYLCMSSWTVVNYFILWTKIHCCRFSRVWLYVTPGTVAPQAPLSLGFSRREYWSRLPCPPPRGLPNPGIRPPSLMSSALTGGFFTTRATWEAPNPLYLYFFWCWNYCYGGHFDCL